ncbi:VOC family protein [Segetibacter aerophilus]|uniref:VOC family protein n=1 Tax=Segetibacter aerophilus TaxID=670293 RepID=A0A512BAR7_9BACT|nr:VOC family protein [Segetibacter aerophilus]GEO09050.1 VOC family protein [Segetibacter aerophilus]
MKLTPYIHFQGNAEEAMHFYTAALGGNVIAISRYGDSPMASDEDYKDKVLHGRIQFGDNVIMISDTFKGKNVQTEGNIQLSIELSEEGQIDDVFKRMSEGGTVTMELQDTFWGARFGMLKDRFGVNWMFNYELKK